MLNKLECFIRKYEMTVPGDTVVCAVSGGADSVALLFGLLLLKDKLGIRLEAAHFNHRLRGVESDRDEQFVREFCGRYDIPLHVGSGEVLPGKKGLEAAARDARYAFLRTLPGKIATAHTADDNGETVLLHLIRGTGLKGLGGITPVSGNVIRPMLSVTREEVEAFLEEWCLSHIEDSSNRSDAFLRNRIRHHVMPLLREENPRIGENLSAMALRLRQDEDFLAQAAQWSGSVEDLKNMHPAQRNRVLERFLKESGVREPEAEHVALAEALAFSGKPSARASFPGGVVIGRSYDALEVLEQGEPLETVTLPCPGSVLLEDLRITCGPAKTIEDSADGFTVIPEGAIQIRTRGSGDEMRLPGGRKKLKKLFIDRKIPAAQRLRIPVIADEQGILGVYGIGPNRDRLASELPAVTIRFEKRNNTED